MRWRPHLVGVGLGYSWGDADLWKVGCSHLNPEPDLLPVPSGVLAESEGSLAVAGGGPDLGWGLGSPLLQRGGVQPQFCPKRGTGQLGGHSQGDREWCPGQPTPTRPSSDRHSRARDDASRGIYSLGIWLLLWPLLWGGWPGVEASGARVAGALGGFSCCLGPQLAPFPPLPMEGPSFQSSFKGSLA